MRDRWKATSDVSDRSDPSAGSDLQAGGLCALGLPSGDGQPKSPRVREGMAPGEPRHAGKRRGGAERGRRSPCRRVLCVARVEERKELERAVSQARVACL